jgi:hypothetical protein
VSTGPFDADALAFVAARTSLPGYDEQPSTSEEQLRLKLAANPTRI